MLLILSATVLAGEIPQPPTEGEIPQPVAQQTLPDDSLAGTLATLLQSLLALL